MPLPDDYDTNDNYHKGRGVDDFPLPTGFDCTPGGTPKLKPARRVWANEADKRNYWLNVAWSWVKLALRVAGSIGFIWLIGEAFYWLGRLLQLL